MCRGEYAWKGPNVSWCICVENCPDSHKPVEIGDLRALKIQGRGGIPGVQPGAERTLPGAPQKGCLSRVRRSWALLRSLVGLWRGTAFHPATRVAVPEAFLARWLGAGHLLRLVEEEPA